MSKQSQGHRLVLYAYTYPAYFYVAREHFKIIVKFGMATLRDGETAEESAWKRMRSQKGQEQAMGSTNEPEEKILLGAWHVRSDKLTADHNVHRLLKDDGYRPKAIFTGSGKEWFLLPLDLDDVHPEAIQLLERIMTELTDGELDAFESVLKPNEQFTITFDGEVMSLSEVAVRLKEKFGTFSFLSDALSDKRRNGSKFTLKELITKALKRSKVASSRQWQVLDQFLRKELVASTVSKMLHSPSLLPCSETADYFLKFIPTTARSLEVVNDPITFLLAYQQLDFDKLTFVGTAEQVKGLELLKNESTVRLVSLGSFEKCGSSDEAKKAFHQAVLAYFDRTTATISILNTPRSVGASVEAGTLWIQPARKRTDLLIVGSLADNFIDQRIKNHDRCEVNQHDMIAFELTSDPMHYPELFDTFVDKSGNDKEHFEPTCVSVFVKDAIADINFDQSMPALVYGPADEHPLPFNGCGESYKLKNLNDVSHLGYIEGTREFVLALKKIHVPVKFVSQCQVSVAKSTGNPRFKKSTTATGISLTFADGDVRDIEKGYLLQTDPLVKNGLVAPSILQVGETVHSHAKAIDMPSLERAEAWIRHVKHDKTLTAGYAIPKMKQTSAKSILNGDLPIHSVPWEDIEPGKLDEYIAAKSGMSLETIRRVVNTVIDRISFQPK